MYLLMSIMKVALIFSILFTLCILCLMVIFCLQTIFVAFHNPFNFCNVMYFKGRPLFYPSRIDWMLKSGHYLQNRACEFAKIMTY